MAIAIGFSLGLNLTAQSAGTQYVSYQKTLTSFASGVTSLTAQQRSQVEDAVRANPSAEKFVCTGIRYVTQPQSANIEIRKRAKAACDYAKQLNPQLSTWVQSKATQARSYAGKVLLTVKSPKGSSTAAERTDGNQAGYLTEGPEAWWKSTKKVPGALCEIEGERVFDQSSNTMECRRYGLTTNRWVTDFSLINYPERTYASSVNAGSTCYRPGDRVSNSSGVLECRYKAGRKLQFVQLMGSNNAPTLGTGLADVSECKMADQRTRIGGGGSTAFPMQYSRIKSNGVVRVAVIPIDFPDSPAPGKPEDFLKDSLDLLDKRNKDLYGNRIQYEWVIPDKWLRMSKSAENYNQDHQTVQPDGSRKADGTKTLLTAEEQLSEIYTAAEKVIDIESIDYFSIFSNPYEPDVQFGPGYVNNITTATKTYTNVSSYPIGFFAFNGHFLRNGVQLFELFSHEIQHAHGMVQHAPGNGTQWFHGGPSTWETWVAGWRTDDQFACIDATKATNAEVSLSSMDLPSTGFKAAIVKLSKTEVLVVESRRDGEFNTAFEKGFAGISVYSVDATKAGDRWDGNQAKEKDYYAYFLRNDRGTYPKLVGGPNLGDLNIAGFEGDSFSYRGVKITLKKSGDYDTITITSTSGAKPLSEEEQSGPIMFQVNGRKDESTQAMCGCCGCLPNVLGR